MKKFILSVLVILAILVGAFFYFTRPLAAPSVDNEDVLSTEPAAQGVSVYRISQPQSVAEFRIKEVLNGKDFTAVGTTSAIMGEFRVVEENDVRSAELGEIKINARTFKTDDARRDAAIARFILKSEEPANEFIVIKSVDAIGFPNNIKYSTEYTYKEVVDVTIAGVTKRETFDVKAIMSKDKITGEVTGTLKRSDFGLVIPNIPFVANVSDTFKVRADIVAEKVSND